ncbi:MAG: PAS domain S-box protein [Candidatus Acidiferrum sp.]
MQERPKIHLNPRPPRWMRTGSILISFAALTLLATAFEAHLYARSLSSALLVLVLLALAVAILLHVRFLLLARREHGETINALDAAEREYKSVFDNTLDAILILDDAGVCLDANPASLALLGCRYRELAGHSVARFWTGPQDSRETFHPLLTKPRERGELGLVRDNGETIFVEYSIKAKYLPGRHVAVLRDISERKRAEAALRESEQRFQQMAANIQEIFWMLDAPTLRVIYINQAYETITGRTCQSLRDNPRSYEQAIHPEDRVRILARLAQSLETGHLDEELRILTPDGISRWVWVRGFPVRDSEGAVVRLVGTALDISARKSAETEMARNLDLAESARAEAEAFRKTSLALTENLSLDYVLDTLLESLLNLIPCDSARVLLVESETRLFLAREVRAPDVNQRGPKCPATLDANDSALLLQVLNGKNGLLVPDTGTEEGWHAFRGFSHLRSWVCVPLVASRQVLGLLSLGATKAHTFTQEHLRLAKSLAIPAAVAIQNARLYEKTEIFRAELERRLADLEQARKELQEAHPARQAHL